MYVTQISLLVYSQSTASFEAFKAAAALVPPGGSVTPSNGTMGGTTTASVSSSNMIALSWINAIFSVLIVMTVSF